MTKNVDLQAKNYEVSIYKNPPLSAEDADLIALGDLDPSELEHSPEFPVGAWTVLCHACKNRWSPPVTAQNVPKVLWFLCPDFCNLSERVANRLLREMREGRRDKDADLVARCLDRLGQIRNPKRAETLEHLGIDWLAILNDNIARRSEWHGRRSEWTPELRAAHDSFD